MGFRVWWELQHAEEQHFVRRWSGPDDPTTSTRKETCGKYTSTEDLVFAREETPSLARKCTSLAQSRPAIVLVCAPFGRAFARPSHASAGARVTTGLRTALEFEDETTVNVPDVSGSEASVKARSFKVQKPRTRKALTCAREWGQGGSVRAEIARLLSVPVNRVNATVLRGKRFGELEKGDLIRVGDMRAAVEASEGWNGAHNKKVVEDAFTSREGLDLGQVVSVTGGDVRTVRVRFAEGDDVLLEFSKSCADCTTTVCAASHCPSLADTDVQKIDARLHLEVLDDTVYDHGEQNDQLEAHIKNQQDEISRTTNYGVLESQYVPKPLRRIEYEVRSDKMEAFDIGMAGFSKWLPKTEQSYEKELLSLEHEIAKLKAERFGLDRVGTKNVNSAETNVLPD